MDMSIGNKLLALRQSKHLSQEELAHQLGVSRQTIGKWEQDLSLPDIKMMMKISDFYHVSMTELLGIKEEKNTEDTLTQMYEQTNLVFDNLQKDNQKRRKRDIFIMLTCLLSLCFNVYLGFKIIETPQPNVISVDHYTETVDTFENELTYFRIKKCDYEQKLVFLDFQCALKSSTESTQLYLQLIDEDHQETLIPMNTTNNHIYTYQDSIPLLDYQHMNIIIKDQGNQKLENIHMDEKIQFINNAIYYVFSMKIPGSANFQPVDKIIYKPLLDGNLYPYGYYEEVVGYPKGTVHLTLYDNDKKVIIDIDLVLDEEKVIELDEELKNHQEYSYCITAKVFEKEYVIADDYFELSYTSHYLETELNPYVR